MSAVCSGLGTDRTCCNGRLAFPVRSRSIGGSVDPLGAVKKRYDGEGDSMGSALGQISGRVKRTHFAAVLLAVAFAASLGFPHAASAETLMPVTDLQAHVATVGGVDTTFLTWNVPQSGYREIVIVSGEAGFPLRPFKSGEGVVEGEGVVFNGNGEDQDTEQAIIHFDTQKVRYLSAFAVYELDYESYKEFSAPAMLVLNPNSSLMHLGARDQIPGRPLRASQFGSDCEGPSYGEVWNVDLAAGETLAVELKQVNFWESGNDDNGIPPTWKFEVFAPGSVPGAVPVKTVSARATEWRFSYWAPLITTRYKAPTAGTYYVRVRTIGNDSDDFQEYYALRWWKGAPKKATVKLTSAKFIRYSGGARAIKFAGQAYPTDAPYVWEGQTSNMPRFCKIQYRVDGRWKTFSSLEKLRRGGRIYGDDYAPRGRTLKLRLKIPACGLYNGAVSNTVTIRR